jgi:hypothetical protein
MYEHVFIKYGRHHVPALPVNVVGPAKPARSHSFEHSPFWAPMRASIPRSSAFWICSRSYLIRIRRPGSTSATTTLLFDRASRRLALRSLDRKSEGSSTSHARIDWSDGLPSFLSSLAGGTDRSCPGQDEHRAFQAPRTLPQSRVPGGRLAARQYSPPGAGPSGPRRLPLQGAR